MLEVVGQKVESARFRVQGRSLRIFIERSLVRGCESGSLRSLRGRVLGRRERSSESIRLGLNGQELRVGGRKLRTKIGDLGAQIGERFVLLARGSSLEI